MRGIGAALLMLSSFLAGLLAVQSKRRRIRLLRELAEALAWMVGELAGKRTPLPELLRNGKLCTTEYALVFFSQLDDSFSQLGERSFCEMWAEAVDRLPYLREEERRELYMPGRELGRAELPRQTAALDAASRYLKMRLEREEDSFRDERKLCLSLPAAAGTLLMILLL